jgi:N-acetylglucosaminyldiphosphoundecaprenol N-acetyl-beta-D-mannosaminyltransferase
MNKNKTILGTRVDDLTRQEILEYLFKNIEKKDKKTFIATINSEILVAAYKNQEFKKVLNSSDLALIDSVGVVYGAKILGFSLKERVPGVDLVETICKEASIRPITVGFLGGRENVAELAANCLKDRYSGLKVAFAIEEWPDSEAKSKTLKCDILFVAFGHKKQELWIAENLPHINVWAAMGVGGSFDYISGNVKRAPKWVQDIGFEWLFRLIRQPWRIRRQSSLIYFVLLILREKFSKMV